MGLKVGLYVSAGEEKGGIGGLWNGKAVGTFNNVYSIPVETSDNPTVPCSYMYKVTIKK